MNAVFTMMIFLAASATVVAPALAVSPRCPQPSDAVVATVAATYAGEASASGEKGEGDVRGARKLSAKTDPVEVTAADLMTKVYGVLDSDLSAGEMVDEARQRLHLIPSPDGDGLWLDSADGYGVDYNGLSPEVSAMARFDGNKLADYAYFFLFPYSLGNRGNAESRQCEFCGCLLQEIYDSGSDMGTLYVTDAVFEACGSYAGNQVDVRLTEETNADSSGRFVVTLTVVPSAYTDYDQLPAMENDYAQLP